jgi:hypothetical protein
MISKNLHAFIDKIFTSRHIPTKIQLLYLSDTRICLLLPTFKASITVVHIDKFPQILKTERPDRITASCESG